MKKILSLLLALSMLLLFCACGEKTSSSETTAETEPPSERDKLNENESLLFEALVKITTAAFYEPSAVKVLEIGDHSSNIYPSEYVVVRLQGENKAGGTLNHYYKICIREEGNLYEIYCEHMNQYHEDYPYFNNYWMYDYYSFDDWVKDEHPEYTYEHNEFAEYKELSDGYQFNAVSADEEFSVGKINRALTEYWTEKGF